MPVTSLYVESNGTVSAEYADGRVPMGPSPGPAYLWDANARAWIYNTALASAQARAKRDALLSETDWSQAGDIPLDTQMQWRPYRQSLRDVPQQPGFPVTINWPTPPA